MATTIRASSQNSATTGTAISVSEPTGTLVGDLVIVSVTINGQTTIADNNGSTPFTEEIDDYKPNTIDGHTVSIFSRIKMSGDPSTYNFTGGASNRWSIVAMSVANPHPNTTFEVSPSTTNAVGLYDGGPYFTTGDAPSINISRPAIHVVCGYGDDSLGGAPTPPSGYTTRGDPVNEPQIVCTKFVNVGATGAKTVTFTTGTAMILLSFAILYSRSLGFQSNINGGTKLRPRPFAPGIAR